MSISKFQVERFLSIYKGCQRQILVGDYLLKKEGDFMIVYILDNLKPYLDLANTIIFFLIYLNIRKK